MNELQLTSQVLLLKSKLFGVLKTHSVALKLEPTQNSHLVELLIDDGLLLRFYRKAKGDIERALGLLVNHIDWRLTLQTHLLCFETMEMSLLEARLFVFWKTDAAGRPVILLNPRVVSGSNDDLKTTLIFVLEITRRWMYQLSTLTEDEKPFQSTLVVDLQGFAFNQMDFEWIPIVYELFQNHFPQFFAQALFLNYGWVHAGIWQVVKNAMTAEACKKVVFLSSFKDLEKLIPINMIPIEYGGNLILGNSPYVCPTILSYGSAVPITKHSPLHVQALNELLRSDRAASIDGPISIVTFKEEEDDEDDGLCLATPPRSPRLRNAPSIEITPLKDDTTSPYGSQYYSAADNLSIHSQSRSASQSQLKIKSAADLQALLRNEGLRSDSGLARTPSTKSLTQLVSIRSAGNLLHPPRKMGFTSPRRNLPPIPKKPIWLRMLNWIVSILMTRVSTLFRKSLNSPGRPALYVGDRFDSPIFQSRSFLLLKRGVSYLDNILSLLCLLFLVRRFKSQFKKTLA